MKNKIRWAIGSTLDSNGVSKPPFRSQQKIAGAWAGELVAWLKLKEEKPNLSVEHVLQDALTR